MGKSRTKRSRTKQRKSQVRKSRPKRLVRNRSGVKRTKSQRRSPKHSRTKNKSGQKCQNSQKKSRQKREPYKGMITNGLRKMLENFGIPHKHLKRRADVLNELLKYEKKSKGWTIPLKKKRYRMDPDTNPEPDPRARFTPANRDELKAAVDAYIDGDQDRSNGPIGTWDVSRVTDMSGLFENHEEFNEDIGDWDTSNVINMTWMFQGAIDFNQPLDTHTVTRVDGTTYTAWDTRKVTTMEGMFNTASAFNNGEAPGLSNRPLNWNVSNVTEMTGMFEGAKSFNQNISNWDTSRVINMPYMFHAAISFNQDISNWDTSRVEDMDWMFTKAKSFNQPINTHTITRSDGSRYKAWDVSNVTNMGWMFSRAKAFDQDISNWNVSNVRYVAHMFDGATAMLRKLPHLQRRNPRGTPNTNDWKADMYPRDQLFLQFKKPRDEQKLISEFMEDLGSTDVLQTPLQSGLQNPSVQDAIRKYIYKERGFLFQ